MMRAYITTAECRALCYPAYDGGLIPRVHSQTVIREATIVKELETGSSLYYACHADRLVAACLLGEFQLWNIRPTKETLRKSIRRAHANALDMDMFLAMHTEDYDMMQSRSSSGSAQCAQPCLVMTLFTFFAKYATIEDASSAVGDRTLSAEPVDASVDFHTALLKRVIDDIGHKRDIYLRCFDPDSAPFFFKYGFDEIGRTELLPKGQPQLRFTSIRMLRRAGPWAPRGAAAYPTTPASNTQHHAQTHQEQGNPHSHRRLQDHGMASDNMIIAPGHQGGMDPNSQSGNAMIATGANSTPLASNTQYQAYHQQQQGNFYSHMGLQGHPQQQLGNSYGHMELQGHSQQQQGGFYGYMESQDQGMTSNNLPIAPDHEEETNPNS